MALLNHLRSRRTPACLQYRLRHLRLRRRHHNGLIPKTAISKRLQIGTLQIDDRHALLIDFLDYVSPPDSGHLLLYPLTVLDRRKLIARSNIHYYRHFLNFLNLYFRRAALIICLHVQLRRPVVILEKVVLLANLAKVNQLLFGGSVVIELVLLGQLFIL